MSKETTNPPVKTAPNYEVAASGYNEKFTSYDAAKKEYDVIKKRSIKNKEAVKVTLVEINDNGKKTTLDSVNISEDFFD